jgi:4-amino-4-deoxy-L-arabinose transferase-like glycosyltransferase
MKWAVRIFAANKLLCILALAFVVHVVVLALLPGQQFPDAQSYRTAASEFRAWRLMVNNEIMPLYPLLVAVVGDGWGQKFADLALSLASIWLVYAIALRIFRDETMALVAALFCAVWPHFVFFAAVGLTETLFITLVLAAFLCLYDRRYVLASAFLVLAILTRPAIDFFAPILVALFSVGVHREPVRLLGRRLLTYLVVYVALMSPWWAYNYARYGQFVRLNLAAGVVLYTGNNPLNVHGGGVSEGPTQDADLSRYRRILDPVEQDRAFRNAAIRYIKDHPWRFVSMMPVKFLRLWRPWPYSDEFQSPWVVAVSVASVVPAFILALAGLATTWRAHFVRLLPCLAYLGYLTLVHVVTFGSVRYRVPLEPFVLIYAAAGLVGLLRRGEFGQRLLAPLAPTR